MSDLQELLAQSSILGGLSSFVDLSPDYGSQQPLEHVGSRSSRRLGATNLLCGLARSRPSTHLQ